MSLIDAWNLFWPLQTMRALEKSMSEPVASINKMKLGINRIRHRVITVCLRNMNKIRALPKSPFACLCFHQYTMSRTQH